MRQARWIMCSMTAYKRLTSVPLTLMSAMLKDVD